MKYLGRPYLLILAALALAVIITVIAYNLFSAAAPDSARSVPVSWVEDDSLLMQVAEASRPAAVLSPHEAPAEPWHVYTVRGDAAPDLFFETTRWPTGLRWLDGSTIAFDYYTAAEPPSSEPHGSNLYRGLALYAPGSSEPERDLSVMGWLERDDGSGRMLANRRFANREGGIAFVIEPDGRALRLEGLAEDLSIYGWSPDGRYAIVYTVERTPAAASGTPPPPAVRTYYAVEPGADRAIEIARTSAATHPTLSPDGRRIAYFQTSDRDAEIATVLTGEIDKGTRRRLEVRVPSYGLLSWVDDGRLLHAESGFIDVSGPQPYSLLQQGAGYIDPESGRVDPILPPRVRGALSPDEGRMLITRTISAPGDGCTRETMPPAELVLVTRSSSEEQVLVECDTQGLIPYQWLDDDRVLLSLFSCCHGQVSGYALLDVSAGDLRPLTNGLEAGARVAISPDGSKMLVSGDRLRLFDRTGSLLRELEAPEGLQFSYVTWSPDGSSFAYVLGAYLVGPL